MSRESFARVDNYIQEEIFGTNLHVVPTKENNSRNENLRRAKRERNDKGLNEIRIPPMEISGGAEIKVIRNSRRR
ncbi:MAG: hypothetical protein ACKN80_06065, partial [Actinomycetales bacterium]